MTTIKPAPIGSISHGTLRNADLLDSFANELQYQILTRNAQHYSEPEHHSERDRLTRIMWDAFELSGHLEAGTKEDGEEASELVNSLSDALGTFAGPYCYFGNHEGDGSDFGYWPDLGSIEDLPKYNDLADVPEDIDEDYQVVNDHGNVTVYSADGVEILSLV